MYHGHNVSVFWDPNGTAYPKAGCTGLCVYLDGKRAAELPNLQKVQISV